MLPLSTQINTFWFVLNILIFKYLNHPWFEHRNFTDLVNKYFIQELNFITWNDLHLVKCVTHVFIRMLPLAYRFFSNTVLMHSLVVWINFTTGYSYTKSKRKLQIILHNRLKFAYFSLIWMFLCCFLDVGLHQCYNWQGKAFMTSLSSSPILNAS